MLVSKGYTMIELFLLCCMHKKLEVKESEKKEYISVQSFISSFIAKFERDKRLTAHKG